MAWYDSAVFYHIYPLGLCGCSKENTGEQEQHFDKLRTWADHAAKMNFTGIYIGPLFESVGHGYETTDYKKVDCRLGSNEDFKEYVSYCHKLGIKVIVDGVFNHVGREFFAFKDVKEKREKSPYCGWFCNLHFGGNNEYNDGFSYDNWGGYNLLVKLNQRHPDVQNYLIDVIRFWVSEFDIDGIRLDAADVLDFDFMKVLRRTANEVKPDFWLMGEVIHGDYSRWVNDEMLHSVTNYELHKGLFSGHNDHNYFEIAHSIKRLNDICRGRKLYTFVDNHDVERIASKLNNKAHLPLVTMLLYTIYGIPSVYYGSEFGIEGRKEKGSDWNLRPSLNLEDYAGAYKNNIVTKLCMGLGSLKKTCRELTEGEYRELYLRNRQFALGRVCQDSAMITALNCDDAEAVLEFQAPVTPSECKDLLGMAKQIEYQNGHLRITLEANTGTVLMLANSVPNDALLFTGGRNTADGNIISDGTSASNGNAVSGGTPPSNGNAASGNTASGNTASGNTASNGGNTSKPTAFGTRNPASGKNLGGVSQPACQVRLDGFGIMANDIKTMVEFYSNVLGFAIHYTDGMRNVCLEKDGTVFMLYKRDDFENLTSQKYPQIDGFKGHFQIALRVDSHGAVDYTYQTVVNQGGRSIIGPKTEEWGQRICYVSDPEGNVIEISAF